MATLLSITFDCADPPSLAAFWAAVQEREVGEGANESYAMLPGSPAEGRPNWMFIKVPEGKAAKNRVHPDLGAPDLDAERARLEALGATFVHEKNEYGVHWFTFADPEGNEFCVAEH
jgi:predicted enzyme related to lactoylglutathione lyase